MLYYEDFTGTIYHARDKWGNIINEITTVNGWVPFWREDPDAVILRPEMQVIDAVPPFLSPPRTNGVRGLKVFKLSSRHDAGYWKQYVIPAGITKLIITATGHHWYSQRDDAFKSEYKQDGIWQQIEDGDPVTQLMVGIDIASGTDPYSSAVAWQSYGWYDQFGIITLEVDNPGALITVFIRSIQEFPFKHSDAYWANVTLESEEEPELLCPHLNHIVTVELMPQDFTLAEVGIVASKVEQYKRTFAHSADDVVALVNLGLQESTVHVWEPQRWTGGDIVQWLHDRDVENVEVFYLEEPPPIIVPPYVPLNRTPYGTKLAFQGAYPVSFLAELEQAGVKLATHKFIQAIGDIPITSEEHIMARMIDDPQTHANLEGFDFTLGRGTPEQQAEQRMAALLPLFAPYIDNGLDSIEIVNEQGMPTDDLEAPVKLARFFIRAFDIAEPLGLRIAWPSLALGNPEPWQWDAMIPTGIYQRAAAFGHPMSLHEYGYTLDGPNSVIGRYRDVFERILIPNGWDIGLYITEFNVADDMFKEDVFAHWKAYDAIVRADPYVAGVHIFLVGTGLGWDDYHDVTVAQFPKFKAYAIAEKDVANGSSVPEPPPPEPPPPEPPPTLAVIPFSQRDPQWASIHLGISSWTMGSAGCAVTCAAMIGSVNDKTTDPSKLVTWLNVNGGFTPDGNLYWVKPAQYYSDFDFEWYYTWRNVGQVADLNVVRDALARGPTIIQVDYYPGTEQLDTHFVVALREEDNDLEIVDPWTGTVKWLSESYWRGTLASSIFALVDYHFVQPPPPVITMLVGFNDHPGDTGTASDWMRNNNLSGLIVRPIFLGGNGSVLDFSQAATAGQRVIVNLRYSWSVDMGGAGTLPLPGTPEWSKFVQAAIYTINNSIGVWGWEIGNEYNNPREWPTTGALTPESIIQTYNAIRSACPTQRMCPGALDPFNAEAGDPRDWLTNIYYGISDAEFVTAHGYIRGPDASLVGSTVKFADAPLQWQYLNYPGCITELLRYLPERYLPLEVYVTEFNHLWKTVEGDWGWVNDQRAADVVTRSIQAAADAELAGLALYRWAGDTWTVEYNNFVLDAVRG